MRAKILLIIFCIVLCIALVHAEHKPSISDSKKIYQHYCSPCHGSKGDGNGFNAKNLDPRPANHTDAGLMSKRTDHEILDAISGGGRAVGKAAIMPPWGNTLDSGQIKSLVRYLRELCGCEEEK